MRWSIIRLIWTRELRDQLRDRRTIMMIAVLPVVLYPLAGLGFLQLMAGFAGRPNVVGVAGLERVSSEGDNQLEHSALVPPLFLAGSAFRIVPGPVAVPWLAMPVSLRRPIPGYPALFEDRAGELKFAAASFELSGGPLHLRRFPDGDGSLSLDEMALAELNERRVDAVLVFPACWADCLNAGQRLKVKVLTRPQDDASRIVGDRVAGILDRWARELKRIRLFRAGLPLDFDEVVEVARSDQIEPTRMAERAAGLLVRILPFILVMWSLAGALYPAVDVCAGEKERGTMETLLISPASREEIVWGKFLTIWVFSAGSAFLNLVSLVFVTTQTGEANAGIRIGPQAFAWAVLLLLPLSAFFSALCLAVGVYARSTKEGQYYLLPLFLVTMPLIFLTLVPGVELNAFTSLLPVSGPALLLQRLMRGDKGMWLVVVPVMTPMVIYSWLALRWAIAQFQREEVLFREAERLDLRLWLAQLLRDKEPVPNTGEALFCLCLLLLLRWLSFGLGAGMPSDVRITVAQLAFVAMPTMLMTILLTTRPIEGLRLRLPNWGAVLTAILLAVVIFQPLTDLAQVMRSLFPQQREWGRTAFSGSSVTCQPLLAFVVLPALCEEIAFRGFILRGICQGFRPWSALMLSSFFYALYRMNVFELLSGIVFGMVAAWLVLSSKSVWTAVAFHLVYNLLVATTTPTEGSMPLEERRLFLDGLAVVLVVGWLGLAWRRSWCREVS